MIPFKYYPGMRLETAAELVHLARQLGYAAVITVHIFVRAVDKEICNEVDAQENIRALKVGVGSC
ncbi:MAG: hypothetical protein AB1330_01545 [Bacillota bacterium]